MPSATGNLPTTTGFEHREQSPYCDLLRSHARWFRSQFAGGGGARAVQRRRLLSRMMVMVFLQFSPIPVAYRRLCRSKIFVALSF